MVFALYNLEAAEKLPIGHYDRAKAHQAVNKEYERCRAQEAKWWKSMSRLVRKDFRSLTVQQAAQMCWHMTNALGTASVKMIYFKSKKVSRFAVAHYNNREIHVGWENVSPRTLVHETAHHIQRMERGFGSGHDEGFLLAEQILFGPAEEWLRKQVQS